MDCEKSSCKTEDGVKTYPDYDDSIVPETVPETEPEVPPGISKKAVAAVAVAGIVLAVIVFTAVTLFDSGYENVLDKYFKSLRTANTNLYMSLLSDDYLNYDGMYSTRNEYKEYFSQELADTQETMLWYCGDGLKITYEILSSTSYSKSEIKESELFVLNYGKENNIEEAVELTLEVSVEGNEAAENITSNISLIKIKGRWYLAESYF